MLKMWLMKTLAKVVCSIGNRRKAGYHQEMLEREDTMKYREGILE